MYSVHISKRAEYTAQRWQCQTFVLSKLNYIVYDLQKLLIPSRCQTAIRFSFEPQNCVRVCQHVCACECTNLMQLFLSKVIERQREKGEGGSAKGGERVLANIRAHTHHGVLYIYMFLLHPYIALSKLSLIIVIMNIIIIIIMVTIVRFG